MLPLRPSQAWWQQIKSSICASLRAGILSYGALLTKK